MKKIPFDIFINHILPYTYNIQSNLLLEDIKNYYLIKNNLLDSKYDTNRIKHEILAIFYGKNILLRDILNRQYINIFNKDICNSIYYYSNNKKFNILLGLFKEHERIKFLEHIMEDNGIWFIKL